MRPLGVAMQREPPDEIHVLLTHLHLDHLQGLGFFRPLFVPDLDIHLWGPTSPVQHLADRIAMYLSPPLFPVRLEDVPSKLTFHDAPETPVTIGSATVRAAKVTHQGPTVGYRIEEHGRALVYLPDHEPSLGSYPHRAPDRLDERLRHRARCRRPAPRRAVPRRRVRRAHRVGSLVRRSMRWSSPRKSAVDQLVLFHHDPYHTDVELEELLVEARGHGGAAPSVCLASEGMTISLNGEGVQLGRLAAFEDREVAVGVLVVPPLFAEHDVQAVHRRRPCRRSVTRPGG